MVSFLTNEGQTDLYGSQLAARQCYQIAREVGTSQEEASPRIQPYTKPIVPSIRGQGSPGSRSLTNNPNLTRQ
ncbi:hypothetical protein AAG906_005786 [Vitis piasezkii]